MTVPEAIFIESWIVSSSVARASLPSASCFAVQSKTKTSRLPEADVATAPNSPVTVPVEVRTVPAARSLAILMPGTVTLSSVPPFTPEASTAALSLA